MDTIAFALNTSRLSMEYPRGHLRVSAPMDLGVMVLPQVLAGFREIHPDISIELILNDSYVDLVQEGFDLAIRAGEGPASATAQNLIARKLGNGTLRLAALPHLAEEIHSLEDLRNAPFVLFRTLGLEQNIVLLNETGEQFRLTVRGEVIVHDFVSMAEFAARGQGVALLPQFHLRYSRLELRPILSNFHSATGNIVVVYPSRQVPLRTSLLITHLTARFGMFNTALLKQEQ